MCFFQIGIVLCTCCALLALFCVIKLAVYFSSPEQRAKVFSTEKELYITPKNLVFSTEKRALHHSEKSNLFFFRQKKELSTLKKSNLFFSTEKELFTHEFSVQVMPYMGFNTQAVVTSRARLGLSKS